MSAEFPGQSPDDPRGDALGDVRGDALGGVPGDLMGDIVSGEPGLDALLGMLTADPAPVELAGEHAALAMFRANLRPAAGAPPAPAAHISSTGAPGRRAPVRNIRRARVMAAAVTLAAAAGLAVAAYTEALPAPLQQAAYHVLGFAGVPAMHHPAPSAASSGPPRPAGDHGTSAGPGHPRKPTAPASSKPSASSPALSAGQASLSITVASGRIVAGRSDKFAGRLTDRAGAVQGANLTLLERTPGRAAWYLAGTAATGSNGGAVVTVQDLITNAAFQLKGPDGALSRPVLVIVVPPVSATVSKSSGKAVTVTASSPLAAPGGIVVLQVQAGAHWLSLQKSHLNSAGQARFLVQRPARQSMYRVVLLPTASHGMSASHAIMVPQR